MIDGAYMRFVILEHCGTDIQTHYDLMIEKYDGSELLTTYRLPFDFLQSLAGKAVAAELIFDHQARFLSYRGAVNNGRGAVSEFDAGDVFEINAAKPCRRYNFCGRKLCGVYNIIEGQDGNCSLEPA